MFHSLPGPFCLVPFVSVDDIMELVRAIGPERMLHGLAETIQEGFRHWESLDEAARVAAHSDEGVIELIPTSDGRAHGF